MNAIEKDKQEQIRLFEKKNKKIMDNRMRNMEEGKYMAPTDATKDPNAWKVYQQGTEEQGFLDANQTFQNNMDFESAAADNLTFGGKKRRTKRRKSSRRKSSRRKSTRRKSTKKRKRRSTRRRR